MRLPGPLDRPGLLVDDIVVVYHAEVARHRKTLEAVFADPPPANLKWSAIEAMLRWLGAEISEGSGSRVRVVLAGRRAVFHRPHPQPEARRSLIRAVRNLLESAGVEP